MTVITWYNGFTFGGSVAEENQPNYSENHFHGFALEKSKTVIYIVCFYHLVIFNYLNGSFYRFYLILCFLIVFALYWVY